MNLFAEFIADCYNNAVPSPTNLKCISKISTKRELRLVVLKQNPLNLIIFLIVEDFAFIERVISNWISFIIGFKNIILRFTEL